MRRADSRPVAEAVNLSVAVTLGAASLVTFSTLVPGDASPTRVAAYTSGHLL